MKSIVDLCTWLLDKDIRAKNAVSFLVALLSVVVFYFSARRAEWIHELDQRGAIALPTALLTVFLIAFLSVGLIYSAIAKQHLQRVAERKLGQQVVQRKNAVRSTLDSLTDWQRKFLLRFIVEGRTQIPEFEVGQFRAAWDFEIEVLIQKRVIREHRRAGVYEIEPIYHDYLRDNWDQQTGTLT